VNIVRIGFPFICGLGFSNYNADGRSPPTFERWDGKKRGEEACDDVGSTRADGGPVEAG
jgi:hypothetical protein